MRVTLNVDALAPGLSGIGRYVWELSKGLRARPEIDVRFHARGRVIGDPEALLAPASPAPAPRRFGYVRRRLRRLFPEPRLDHGLIHGPNYFLPDFAETGVITVHDLSVLRFPETHPRDRIEAFALSFERSLARAAHVLTDSETVRGEIIDEFGIAPDRVTAVLLGVDNAFCPRPPEALDPTLWSMGLQAGGYALCVSTLEPRKRIADLIEAWSRLRQDLRTRYPLVLAGGAGWLNEQLMAQIDAGVREGWLRNLGFVEEPQLPLLYAGASLFLYPSTYEGFGLPPLEAMASGVPVIVADRSCLPEVTGGAAMLIDPQDSDAFVAAIERGLTDEQWRCAAIHYGLVRAAELSWDRCLNETVDVYRKVVQPKGG